KPARGDFLPVIDGGYALQYSPLMQYREGKGIIIFCQLDVTGRTESEPAAQRIVRNMLNFAKEWKPQIDYWGAVYIGGQAGRTHLEDCGFSLGSPNAPKPINSLLILGPGCERALTEELVRNRVHGKNNRVLTIGLGADQLRSLLRLDLNITTLEHIGPYGDSN